MGISPFDELSPPFRDPADDWDEDDDYEYDDTRVALGRGDELPHLNRPDYIGIVSGAEYKLDDGISSYALAIVTGSHVLLCEVSDGDLEVLARQIDGLLKRPVLHGQS